MLTGVAEETTADALGRFSLGRPAAAGAVRFRCELATAVILTDWIQLY